MTNSKRDVNSAFRIQSRLLKGNKWR